ncbi:MAG: T9SS type A sorting domain-containing protein [Chitinophagaceae bacterium]|jgi:hypothetical protein|nr:T9SS type A sorting domain-containing protein [Chitinophagaceae bacterium]
MHIASLQWSIDNSPPPGTQVIINSPTSPSTTVSISTGAVALKLNYKDDCGNAFVTNGIVIYKPCSSPGSAYSVSPNPASSSIDIQPVTESVSSPATLSAPATASGTLTTSSSTPEITQVNIYDKSGNRRHQQGFSKVRRAKLNIAKLPAGIYYVEIIMNDGTKEKHTLSVAH